MERRFAPMNTNPIEGTVRRPARARSREALWINARGLDTAAVRWRSAFSLGEISLVPKIGTTLLKKEVSRGRSKESFGKLGKKVAAKDLTRVTGRRHGVSAAMRQMIGLPRRVGVAQGEVGHDRASDQANRPPCEHLDTRSAKPNARTGRLPHYSRQTTPPISA